jgi:hypothetical protein
MRGARTRPQKRRSLRSAFWRASRERLLGAEDRVLGGLGHAELHDLLGLDLDRFAGGRVATLASFAVDEDELAEAREREGVLRVLVGEGGDDLEDRGGLLLADLSFFGDGTGDLGLGEGFGHVVCGLVVQ